MKTMAVLRLSRLVLRFAGSLALAIAILWASAALWIDGPESFVLAGTLSGGLVLISGLAAVFGARLSSDLARHPLCGGFRPIGREPSMTANGRSRPPATRGFNAR